MRLRGEGLGLRPGSRRKALINVTSLIDVVFLLLIFFVVTSTFLERPGLDLSLPSARSAEVAAREEATVVVTSDGEMQVDGVAVGEVELEAALEEAIGRRESKRVILEVDERVPHGRVVRVMDAARSAGAAGLVVATRPREESPGAEP